MGYLWPRKKTSIASMRIVPRRKVVDRVVIPANAANPNTIYSSRLLPNAADLLTRANTTIVNIDKK
ncbi:hypothetical protein ODE01S_21990 [Oceanithermus desulfurans NBRC 100063]|uniref:Uncharacterized protein n=1 Tax=Oceanithermus desulfurans NBRC 100063 TaxID=1227550 RepID=A0A511RM91_9DEIN|nr:hypothetical protein ODE01S_21990 [Oceanithermus desulfurans NBRC 100063]